MNELPTTAAGTLNLLANTQTEIDVFSDSVIASVKEGEVSPLKVLIQLRAMERASKRILSMIQENYMNAADLYVEKQFEFLGNLIEKTELGTKYDYTRCGDPVWEQRKAAADSADGLVKEREAFLKALRQPVTIVIEETGEVVKINPPTKTSTSGLKVTIR